MKILKIKLGLFSLLAILAVSVFLTSCEQEEIISEPSIDEVNLLKIDSEIIESEFILPYGYDELSPEERNEYLNSLDNEEFSELVNSKKVRDYFLFLGKGQLLLENREYGQILGDNDLNLLSSSEVSAFATFNADEYLESRNCTAWTNVGSPYCLSVGWGPWGVSRLYQNKERSCDQWSWGCMGFCSTWKRVRISESC